MSINKKSFSNYIHDFNFRELFNHMGWNKDKTSKDISIDENIFSIQAVAQKSGFKIFCCSPDSNGKIPVYATRKKIETKITKLFQEHLIIFVDERKSEQIWQLVVRQSGKPSKLTETRYKIGQDPVLLFQRASGMFFEMHEEDSITIVDVTKRVNENFNQNNERVTKRFYDRFKKEHASFMSFIKGIEDRIADIDNRQKQWYASIMLNRLMFCYFIQKKGFLDNNRNYLREKLIACQKKKGKNKFYSFYRDFLLVLFHEGLNEANQKDEVKVEIGKIPYLNGGLFDVHELEKSYAKINVNDDAFEKIFDFFDQYEWHLDTREHATGNEVNPDVIGYIFEKYINDRSAMGAYYTKEDITEYISKNCIVPFLFDEVARSKDNSILDEAFEMLQNSGDEYIYDAVKFGIDTSEINDETALKKDLPADVIEGIDANEETLVEKRKAWNKSAPSDIALPTEIYRELIDRRKRYLVLKSKIVSGEVKNINDFITYNLNIRQFVQDVLLNTSNPALIGSFYQALTKVTIIDPTCGSGAFLFAAMNILEPLYDVCLMRMRAFVEDEDSHNATIKPNFSNKYKEFRKILAETQNEHHPNLQYFIFKSIILQNLYGVDIMHEAVEIAKLRLFLKLVATVEPDRHKHNMWLEPLPDIDFNIRAGNTLVGFANKQDLDKAFEGVMDFDNDKGRLEEQCEIVARAFQHYKNIQLQTGDDYANFKTAKYELQSRLKKLTNELDLLLHKQADGLPFDTWEKSHQPFHWFAEFYEIIHQKQGFDVIIGNPPYVEHSSNYFSYSLNHLITWQCGNLYGNCIERGFKIGNKVSYFSFIIPVAITCSKRMDSVIKIMKECSNFLWLSNFDDRPGKLFEMIEHLRASIFISQNSDKKHCNIFSTNYLRWYTENRLNLFSIIEYTHVSDFANSYVIPKLSHKIETSILKKLLFQNKKLSSVYSLYSNNHIYYRAAGGGYFLLIKNEESITFINNSKEKVKAEKAIRIIDEIKSSSVGSILSSSLFYWYYIAHTDCRNLSKSFIDTFPVNENIFSDNEIVISGDELFVDYERNKITKNTFYQTTGNSVIYDEYYPKKSKPIIDEIDTVIAKHYGFTAEELDFIINYDIKYRMGKELKVGEDEE